MAKSVVAFSLEEFDPSYTRVLIGNADFRNSQITDLGTLEVITGIAVFRNSQVEDLGNLTTIGGYADFDGSKVENLDKLTTISGDAIFRNSQVENLGNLTTIGRNADFYGNEKLKNLGNLTTIRGYANFIKSQVKNLGNLTIIYGDADFRNSQVKDLGNLTTIGGYANFRDSQVKNLGNLTTIESDADFRYSKVKNLGNLTTIGGYADFKDSPITDLGNLTTIVGSAYFNESAINDLGKLQTIGGDAYFNDSQITDLGNLTTIEGNAYFEEREDLKEEWERRQNKYKKGGRTISQTPAPKKDRVYGSEKNKPKSSTDTKSAEKITFSEKTLESIEKKVNEHNKAYPNKKITLASAKAVVRRGMGAYSSTHRPTISGGKPNSRVAWGLARLNAFIYKIINGKSKSGKYSQDNDLIEELGYKVDKYEIGGIFHGSRSYFDKFSTNKIGSGIGRQEDGWGIYLTDDKESSKNYGNYIYETTLFKGKRLDEYIFLDLNKPVKKDIESKIIEYFQKAGYNVSELNEFNYSGYLFYKTLSRKLGGDKKASLFLLNNGIDGLRRTFENSKGVVYRTDYVIFDENAITIERKEYLPNNYFSDGGELENTELNKIKEAYDFGSEYFESEIYGQPYKIRMNKNHPRNSSRNDDQSIHNLSLINVDYPSAVVFREKYDKLQYQYDKIYDWEDAKEKIQDFFYEIKDRSENYSNGGEINQNMKNEIIDILSKNARYGTKIFDLQKVGLEVIQNCIESNTYFGNAIKQANENYIMIPVKYDDKLWAIDKKVEYVYYAKPNQNTKIRVEYKYDMQDYPTPVLFDSETMNNEEFHDVNDYEEINVEEFDSEFLYRGINNNEMLSIIENGFIKSNASMNIGEQQENTTSFAQHISQASSYAVGFNAWFDEVTFAKPKYILKVKKEGVNYKPTIETDVENEVDVFGEIPIQQIESIYEIKLGECQMGMVEINVGYKNDFSDGSRFPMFKKVFVRKTDINSLINENKSKNKIEKNREHLPNNYFFDGGLIAPNGKPSNLTPEQYKLVRTPEFKAWFGDWENNPENASKVVDENGEPLVVYHGTYLNEGYFTEFNNVSYFTDNIITAQKYPIDSYDFYENYDDYLSDFDLEETDVEKLKKYDYDVEKIKKGNILVREDDWSAIWKDYDPSKLFVYECFLNLRNPQIIEDADNEDITYLYENSDRIEDAKIENYDSIVGIYPYKWFSQDKINYHQGIIGNYENEKHFITFRSNQIKLADGTNTTFDSNNPDIRYAGGGNVESKLKVKSDILFGKIYIEILLGQKARLILTETTPKYQNIDAKTINKIGLKGNDKIGIIDYLEVSEGHKGKGYAKVLMKKAIEIAKEKGLMPLYLNASPNSDNIEDLDLQSLTKFYESFGFQVFLKEKRNNLMILFDGSNPDIRFMAGGQVLNLNKIRKGQYEAKSDKIEISLTNPKVLNGIGTNKWQLIIEYSNDIIVNQWFDTMNEALKTGAFLLSDFLDSNNTETRFMAGGRIKKAKTDRSGNPIGDGNFHVDYFVEDMTEYPQVKISVSKSDSTESVYVRYFNEDNAESITLRFSMHENNAVKFGYQLNGYTASKNDILYELGLINRKFVPNTYLSITKRQVKKVDLPKYEESNLSIKEMYDLGEGADISMHKGKIAKGSNYLIQGDTVEKIIADTGRFEYFVNGGNVPKKVKFDIEEDEDEDRTEISINGVGKVILTMTYPEYEFMDDIGEDGLEELGIEEGEIIGKIEHIQIEDTFKGKGYAKLLMKKAIEIAEEKGLMPLYLNASPMGSRGLNIDDLTALYESFGFQVFLEQSNNNLMILK